MLTEEHFELFKQFRIKAMGDKLREMVEDDSYDQFTFEEKMEMLIDAEAAARRERKIAKLVKDARFKDPSACVEDVVYLPDRTLAKDRVARLAQCGWVDESEVVVVISKTGCGKSYVIQAIGNAACRKLIPVRYTRLADICDDLNRARAAQDGSYFEKMDGYKSVALLLVDDFMTTPISTQNSVDLFEIMEAREGRRATVIASQLEPNEWYLRIEGELMADSILTQPHSNRSALHRPRRPEHARVLRKEEGGRVALPKTAYSRYRFLLIDGTKPGDWWYRERLLLNLAQIVQDRPRRRVPGAELLKDPDDRQRDAVKPLP